MDRACASNNCSISSLLLLVRLLKIARRDPYQSTQFLLPCHPINANFELVCQLAALLSFTDKINGAIQSGNHADASFTDLTAALG